jgi:NADP-dependent 3-hydroxy acid dehydrogenase YdfG
MRFSNKFVIVTGAAGGIGSAIAIGFLAAMLWCCELFWGDRPVRCGSTFMSLPAARL